MTKCLVNGIRGIFGQNFKVRLFEGRGRINDDLDFVSVVSAHTRTEQLRTGSTHAGRFH